MHAWISGKRRVAIWEDEVTSCVFGSLRFLEPQQAWRICVGLFGDRVGQCIELPVEKVTKVDVRLWPHFKTPSRFIEPDVHIVARGHDGLVATILVEVKWDAPLRDDQLLQQWRWLSVPDQEELAIKTLRNQTMHVFLYRGRFTDRENFECQKEKANEKKIGWGEHGERLVAISWHDLARYAADLNGKLSGAACAWQGDLLRFLKSQGIVAFQGFQNLCPVDPIKWRADSFRGPKLHSVDRLNWSLEERNIEI